MFDIGIQEILVIMVLALIVFGPDKLPELGRRLGRAMREFRRASDEFRSTVEQNLQLHMDPEPSPPPATSSEPATATAAAASAPNGHGGAADGHGTQASPVDGLSGAGTTGAEAADEPLEPYWTSRGGKLLHRRDCVWRARVPVSERIPLKAPGDGWEQGLKPCPVCDPKEAVVAS
jgi:TatA/E family protein of Tat protein translocase